MMQITGGEIFVPGGLVPREEYLFSEDSRRKNFLTLHANDA